MIVNMHEAKTTLSQLVERVAAGEEVIIARAGVPVAQLVPVKRKHPIKWGTLKGKIWMSDDFDDPLPDDIQRAFEGLDP